MTENYWPQSKEDLVKYIDAKIAQHHNYNTSALAMAEVAIAAFNYVAKELGTTGFQASFAGIEFLANTRNIKGPFSIVEARDLTYPQYNIEQNMYKQIEEWMPWAIQQCKKNLAEKNREHVGVNVWKHWEDMAALESQYPTKTE